MVKGNAFTMHAVRGQRIRVSDDIDAGAEFSAYPKYTSVKGLIERRKPRLRKNFTPLALAVRVTTDAQGKANILFKLPDNLTRYKITVVAAAGARQFGKGESSLTAALPLNLRLSAPRFARQGDHFELKAVLANQGTANSTVQVAVRGSGLKPQGVQVELKPDERAEVGFPVDAEAAGSATFQGVAVSNSSSDQAQLTLPVTLPATRTELATYGRLDEPVGQRFELPKDLVKGSETVTLDLSGTPRGQLREAVRQLVEEGYDHGTWAAAVLLTAKAWPEAVPSAVVQSAQARLLSLQDYGGGFCEWSRDDEASPFLTLLAAQALGRTNRELTDYVKNDLRAPSAYTEVEQNTFRAYRVEVLRQLGQPQLNEARELAKKDPTLPAVAWLLPTLRHDPLRAALLKKLVNSVREEAGTAHFVTDTKYEKGHWLLGSDAETDAVLLDALLQVDPQNSLILPLARGLARPHALSETATAYSVVALSRLPQPAARTTDVWAGPQHLLARLGQTALPPTESVILGASRLYYRLGLGYATTSPLPPENRGFALERTYEAVDDNRDVSHDADGWTVKAGALVRVKLTLVVPAERYGVALTDPLPAGLEVINPALQGSTKRDDPTDSDEWWFGHHNLRDDRVEAFADELPEGVYTYSYLARATTAGTFQAAPAQALELATPEVSGRSGSARLTVKQGN